MNITNEIDTLINELYVRPYTHDLREPAIDLLERLKLLVFSQSENALWQDLAVRERMLREGERQRQERAAEFYVRAPSTAKLPALPDLTELERLANSEVCRAATWITPEWGAEHYGSEAEGQFASLASPKTVAALIENVRFLQAVWVLYPEFKPEIENGKDD